MSHIQFDGFFSGFSQLMIYGYDVYNTWKWTKSKINVLRRYVPYINVMLKILI